jgi:hypothetical protein
MRLRPSLLISTEGLLAYAEFKSFGPSVSSEVGQVS